MSNYRTGKACPNPQRALRIVEMTGGLVTLDDLRPLHKDEDCSDFELVARSIMRRLGYSIEHFVRAETAGLTAIMALSIFVFAESFLAALFESIREAKKCDE